MMNFFSEYVKKSKDRLKYISNFSGSYGLGLILKKKIIYLWMEDIPYKQICSAEKVFKIKTMPGEMPIKVLSKKKLKLDLIHNYLQKIFYEFFLKKLNVFLFLLKKT